MVNLRMREKNETWHETISDPVLSGEEFLKKALERKLSSLFSQNVKRKCKLEVASQFNKEFV